jgi:phage N-6-adenine-methyltransferase
MNTTSSGAALNRHNSRQDYETPADFLAAVVRRFGPLDVDLAATPENAKAEIFITPEQDSLKRRWSGVARGTMWLNPPFANIAPWAAKCAEEAPRLSHDSRILLLVPASVGANWFAQHVHGHAFVLALQGRLTFGGCEQPYPKDLVLAVYHAGLTGFDVWSWRERP